MKSREKRKKSWDTQWGRKDGGKERRSDQWSIAVNSIQLTVCVMLTSIKYVSTRLWHGYYTFIKSLALQVKISLFPLFSLRHFFFFSPTLQHKHVYAALIGQLLLMQSCKNLSSWPFFFLSIRPFYLFGSSLMPLNNISCFQLSSIFPLQTCNQREFFFRSTTWVYFS